MGFAFCDHSIIAADGAIAPRLTEECTRRYGRHELAEGMIARERLPALALRGSVTLQATLFRRELVGRVRFRNETALVADFDLMLRVACHPEAKTGYYSPRRLVEYRLHADQVTRSNNPGELHRVSIITLQACSVPVDCQKQYRERLAAHYIGLAVAEACEGRRRSAVSTAWKSLSIHLSALGVLKWAAVVCLPPFAILALRQVHQRSVLAD